MARACGTRLLAKIAANARASRADNLAHFDRADAIRVHPNGKQVGVHNESSPNGFLRCLKGGCGDFGSRQKLRLEEPLDPIAASPIEDVPGGEPVGGEDLGCLDDCHSSKIAMKIVEING
jgi:hypothetical protein